MLCTYSMEPSVNYVFLSHPLLDTAEVTLESITLETTHETGATLPSLHAARATTAGLILG